MLPRTLLIGCGEQQVKRIKEACTVIDISEDYLARSKMLKPDNAYFNASAEDMPFEDNYFSKAICTEVLEHVDNYELALKEISRVIKEGGALRLSVPISSNEDYVANKVEIVKRDVAKGFHKQNFSDGVLLNKLIELGFKDVKIKEKDLANTFYWLILGKSLSLFKMNDKVVVRDSGRVELKSRESAIFKNFLRGVSLVSYVIGGALFVVPKFFKRKYYSTYEVYARK